MSNHIVLLVCVRACVSSGIHLVDVTHPLLCTARRRSYRAAAEPDRAWINSSQLEHFLKHHWRFWSQSSGKPLFETKPCCLQTRGQRDTFQLGGGGKSQFAVKRLNLFAVGKTWARCCLTVGNGSGLCRFACRVLAVRSHLSSLWHDSDCLTFCLTEEQSSTSNLRSIVNDSASPALGMRGAAVAECLPAVVNVT